MNGIILSHDILERACRRSGFPIPADELVLFGIRGAVPSDRLMGGFATSHPLDFAAIDHRTMRCTIGQWRPSDGTLAVYLGSTVPSLPNIARAKQNGGAGANMLMPGRFDHVKGQHKGGQPSGHRAFRQASFFPVRRTRDNTSYDNFDVIDFGRSPSDFVMDNLHCSYSETAHSFSSAGCQVVCGLPQSPRRGMAEETGPWKEFIRVAYGDFAAQPAFTYLLFPAEEIAMLSAAVDSELSQLVRFGSMGEGARIVQDALRAKGLLGGASDSDFGRASLKALVEFQGKTFPPAVVDGVCGPNTAAALGIALPPVSGAQVPAAPPRVLGVSLNNPDIVDETDMSNIEIAGLLRRLGVEAPAAPVPEPVVTIRDTSAPAAVEVIVRAEPAPLANLQPPVTVEPKVVGAPVPATPGLTPVNAALGPMVGNLLDGKKTIVGLIGSVVTAIGAFGPASVEKITAAITEALPFIEGGSGIFLPIFAALTVWGSLGKVEKIVDERKPT